MGLGILLLLLLPGLALVGRYCWALHQLRIGRGFLERYHFVEARPYLEASLRLRPDDAQTLLLLARAARRASAVAQAEKFLDRYQSVHGQTEEWSRERIFVTAARGDVDKVCKYCQKLVTDNDPDAVLALEAMVQGYFRVFRLDEGYGVLSKWLELFPDNTQALTLQAGVWVLLRHHEQAKAVYEHLLEVDPEDDMARLSLATMLLELRLHTVALPHLELLVQRQPNNLVALVQLAQCRVHFGREAEAVELLDHVLSREPNFSLAIGERGRIALQQGQTVFAEECFRKVLVHEPGNYDLVYRLLQCLERNGKLEEADRQRQLLNQLNIDVKRLDEITARILPSRPHDLELQHELALLLLKTGRDQEGLEWLHRILREKPSYLQAHQTLAEFYRQIGDEQQAAFHQQFLVAPQQASSIANP